MAVRPSSLARSTIRITALFTGKYVRSRVGGDGIGHLRADLLCARAAGKCSGRAGATGIHKHARVAWKDSGTDSPKIVSQRVLGIRGARAVTEQRGSANRFGGVLKIVVHQSACPGA